MKITTSQVITYLPEISGSITQVKSVLLKHRKATINKKITAGDVIYFLRGCHRYFIQCALFQCKINQNLEQILFQQQDLEQILRHLFTFQKYDATRHLVPQVGPIMSLQSSF